MDFMFQLQLQAHRLWEEPQHADRSECSREDSLLTCPLLPVIFPAAEKKLPSGHKEPVWAGVGPVDRLCPLLADRDAARLPGRAKLLGGSRGPPPIEAEHPLFIRYCQVPEINEGS